MGIRLHVHAGVLFTAIVAVPALAHGDPVAPAPSPSASSAPAAAPSPKERFAGSFAYVGGDKEIAARDAAIDSATASMFFAIRGTARSRLRESTPVAESVRLAFPSGNISVVAAAEPPAVSPESGGSVAYKSRSGTDLRLSQRITPDGKVAQTFTGENGSRSVVFVLSADGKTLSVFHTVSSSKLPQSVSYRLTYRRT